MEILSSGTGEFRFTDPDVIRHWMRDHKPRDFAFEAGTLSPSISPPSPTAGGPRNLWGLAEFNS